MYVIRPITLDDNPAATDDAHAMSQQLQPLLEASGRVRGRCHPA